ncbi:uncharacterized protein LOC123260527 [Cotesia glomerata]|uniref:Chitin-binding type-2 domain-containing protein n=1 Tax=Cotesia glomerata TaxID=32391 RepID=A0AAV7HW89_COTGL|nr:uncharacterized protein LOC123260527 [Cotesia glomerata]KAH0549469.1 hypothetical protein KQX54_009514 [Cotesia glomerata]
MFKFLMIVSTTVLSIVLSHPFDACIGKCPQSKNPIETPILLAHQDCTKYCFCNDGCLTVKTCQRNFHFSMDDRICLSVELAKCNDRRNCLGTCPIVYNTVNVLLLPHYNSSKFCHCREWGVPTVETCPESLVFNIKYGQCQKPIPDCSHFEIGASTACSVGGGIPSTIPPIPPGDLNVPILIFPKDVQTSTSANSVSEDGTTVSVNENEVTTTISSTEASDSDSTTPVINNKDETTGSEEEPTTVAGKEAVTNEPNPEELKTITSNIDDAATTVSEIEVPDSENLVTDAPNDEDSTTLKSKIDVIVDNNPPIITEKVHVDNYLPSNVDDCIGQCPLENDIYSTKHLPHKDCEQYCKCDWGKPTVMRCSINLHFNRDLEVCDYPINANCSGIGAITTL